MEPASPDSGGIMKKLLACARSNIVAVLAILALIISLSGTAYAAFSLPAGSVGTRALRDRSITPAKLDRRFTGAVVRYWAVVDGNGHVLASSRPRPRTAGFGFGGGNISFGRPQRGGIRCFALGSIADPVSGLAGSSFTLSAGVDVGVTTYNTAGREVPAKIAVAVLCGT